MRKYKTKIKGPFILEGKSFQFLKDVASHYGMTGNNLTVRMRDGWTLEQAVGIEKKEKSSYSGIDISVNGQTYPSIKSAAEAFKLDYKIVHSRLGRGYSIEQAFGLIEIDYESKPKKFTLEGREFSSLVNACKFYKVDKYVLNARINRYGWSLEEGLGIKPRPGYERGVAGLVYLIRNKLNQRAYVGITMGTLEQRWQQHLDKASLGKNLHQDGLHQDISELGPDAFEVQVISKAKTAGELSDMEVNFIMQLNSRSPAGYNLNSGGGGTKTSGKKIVVLGKSYPSITAACRDYSLERRKINQRLSDGWKVEEAFGLVFKPSPNKPKAVIVDGVEYKSISQAELSLNLGKGSISRRLVEKNGKLYADTKSSNRNEIKFRGKKYPSVSALCKEYEISRGAFDNRKLKGWTIEECLGLVEHRTIS